MGLPLPERGRTGDCKDAHEFKNRDWGEKAESEKDQEGRRQKVVTWSQKEEHVSRESKDISVSLAPRGGVENRERTIGFK